MAITFITINPDGTSVFTGLSSDTPTAADTPITADVLRPGSIIWDSDTPGIRQYNGSTWNPISSDGAGHVTQKTTAILGAYDADKATSITSMRETIPSSAQKLWVCNESVTTLQSVRFVFGDSSIVAVATGGYRVSPGITTAAGDNGPKDLEVEVPTDATHWAYIAESGTPIINVVWKF